mmetsp:Transcript_19016/g.72658  ORF Transcript_19016/g.72658 Transcript_19016/m.72658 type:complete len:249 (+) Transcript_19016:220-966(+)
MRQPGCRSRRLWLRLSRPRQAATLAKEWQHPARPRRRGRSLGPPCPRSRLSGSSLRRHSLRPDRWQPTQELTGRSPPCFRQRRMPRQRSSRLSRPLPFLGPLGCGQPFRSTRLRLPPKRAPRFTLQLESSRLESSCRRPRCDFRCPPTRRSSPSRPWLWPRQPLSAAWRQQPAPTNSPRPSRCPATPLARASCLTRPGLVAPPPAQACLAQLSPSACATRPTCSFDCRPAARLRAAAQAYLDCSRPGR